VKIGRHVILKGISLDINIGEDFEVYENCVFEFGLNSKLKIGKSCLFSYGVIIQNTNSIQIGNYVQIGEYSSVRDTTHQYKKKGVPFKMQADVSNPIIIGNNVWIGKCCIIMPGTIIEDNVIIGANSVVKGTIKKSGIYAGAPIRFIKTLD
jgi:acetyltransferase-like isoleucine patch superfamily enzyme